jgi:hypothetical protein
LERLFREQHDFVLRSTNIYHGVEELLKYISIKNYENKLIDKKEYPTLLKDMIKGQELFKDYLTDIENETEVLKNKIKIYDIDKEIYLVYSKKTLNEKNILKYYLVDLLEFHCDCFK